MSLSPPSGADHHRIGDGRTLVMLGLGGASEKMAVDRDSSIVVPRSRPARLHDEVAGLFGAFRHQTGHLGETAR